MSFRIISNEKSTSAVQLIINFNVLLPPATKIMELINFSKPKHSFGRRDTANCRLRGRGTGVGGRRCP